MFSIIPATATATVIKTGKPFAADRYSIFLLVNGIYTKVHAHARTKSCARAAARQLMANAQEYIEEAGMMPALFQQISAEADGRTHLPLPGEVVWLTKEVAGLPVGSMLYVVESGWREEDEGCLPENTFPVMAIPLKDGKPDSDAAPFPLSLDEFSTASVPKNQKESE